MCLSVLREIGGRVLVEFFGCNGGEGEKAECIAVLLLLGGSRESIGEKKGVKGREK